MNLHGFPKGGDLQPWENGQVKCEYRNARGIQKGSQVSAYNPWRERALSLFAPMEYARI